MYAMFVSIYKKEKNKKTNFKIIVNISILYYLFIWYPTSYIFLTTPIWLFFPPS